MNALGGQGNALSSEPAVAGDRYVVFASAATNLVQGDNNRAVDVFLRDRVAGSTERVSVSIGPQGQANGPSTKPTASADGRYVAFTSGASNLVAGDTNGRPDVFVRDRQAASTTRVSLGAGQAQANRPSGVAAISADGRYVAFDLGRHQPRRRRRQRSARRVRARP